MDEDGPQPVKLRRAVSEKIPMPKVLHFDLKIGSVRKAQKKVKGFAESSFKIFEKT